MGGGVGGGGVQVHSRNARPRSTGPSRNDDATTERAVLCAPAREGSGLAVLRTRRSPAPDESDSAPSGSAPRAVGNSDSDPNDWPTNGTEASFLEAPNRGTGPEGDDDRAVPRPQGAGRDGTADSLAARGRDCEIAGKTSPSSGSTSSNRRRTRNLNRFHLPGTTLGAATEQMERGWNACVSNAQKQGLTWENMVGDTGFEPVTSSV